MHIGYCSHNRRRWGGNNNHEFANTVQFVLLLSCSNSWQHMHTIEFVDTPVFSNTNHQIKLQKQRYDSIIKILYKINGTDNS